MIKVLHIDKGAESVTDTSLASLCVDLQVVVDKADGHDHAENQPQLLQQLEIKLDTFMRCNYVWEYMDTLTTILNMKYYILSVNVYMGEILLVFNPVIILKL